MGTQESLLQAANFIEAVESRQGLKIACVEEIAYRMGYIDAAQVEHLAQDLRQTGYGQYFPSAALERVMYVERHAGGMIYRGSVIPAYAGIQFRGDCLDSCVRRNDHDVACAVC